MDEMGQNIRSKRARVLRATDVIPPFDRNSAPAETAEINSSPSEPLEAEPGDGDGRARNGLGAEVGGAGPANPAVESSPVESPEIPKYDLAENILAEQRRVAAARRRRASSPAEHEPPAPPEQDGQKSPACEFAPEDLPELQRTVAEIVARDIERLCRRPDR